MNLRMEVMQKTLDSQNKLHGPLDYRLKDFAALAARSWVSDIFPISSVR